MKVIVGSDIPHYTRSVGQFDNRMAYVVALRELGHEAIVLADVYPERCFDSDHRPVGFDEYEGRRNFDDLARTYVDDLRYCLVYDGGTETQGMSFDEAVAHAESADVLINIGGKLRTPELLKRVDCKIFVDLAPAKTQAYEVEYGFDQGLREHDLFFTVGTKIGDDDCSVPTCGLDWHRWMHPVPLSMWPDAFDSESERFTTISDWSGKETFVLNGVYSGEKSDQWRRFVEVPRITGQAMEIALRIPPGWEEDAQMLDAHGWSISDPHALRGPADLQRFIASSRGEFSVANQRYTEFRTGWHSERTARYLASGKPVIVQSTGIEDHVPTGVGFLTFSTLDEAAAAVDAVNADYASHSRAARDLAEHLFDGKKLLSGMLESAS